MRAEIPQDGGKRKRRCGQDQRSDWYAAFRNYRLSRRFWGHEALPEFNNDFTLIFANRNECHEVEQQR
jgi:hypothetical protein